MTADPLTGARTAGDRFELVEEFRFVDSERALRVLGPQGAFLSAMAAELDVKIGQRGDTLIFRGGSDAVRAGIRLMEQLSTVVQDGHALREADVLRGARILSADPDARLANIFNDVVHVTDARRLITPRGLAQKRYVDAIRRGDLTFGIGPAGTGKTYLAVAVAVNALLAGKFRRIVLTRPAVEAGEKLGFLPGDMVEKINPYVRPLYDALHDMLDPGRTAELIATGQIEIAPLAFMRGRTLNDAFVILDEAQNTTRAQMKMFLTRLGYSSKAVVTGDVTQLDLPAGTPSGLLDARRVLSGVNGIRFCDFSAVDVVRHELVQRIIVAYEQADAPAGQVERGEGSEQ